MNEAGSTNDSNRTRFRDRAKTTAKKWASRFSRSSVAGLIFLATYLGSRPLVDSIFKDGISNNRGVFSLTGAHAQPIPADKLKAVDDARMAVEKILQRETAIVNYNHPAIGKLYTAVKAAGKTDKPTVKEWFNSVFKATLQKDDKGTGLKKFQDGFKPIYDSLKAKALTEPPKAAPPAPKLPAEKPAPKELPKPVPKPPSLEDIAARAARGLAAAAKRELVPSPVAKGEKPKEPVPPRQPPRLGGEEEKPGKGPAVASAAPLPMGALSGKEIAAQSVIFAGSQQDFVVKMGEEAKKTFVASRYNQGQKNGIAKLIDAETRAVRNAGTPEDVEKAYRRMKSVVETVEVLCERLKKLDEFKARWETETDKKKRGQYRVEYNIVRKEFDKAIAYMLTERKWSPEKRTFVPKPLDERLTEALKNVDFYFGKAVAIEEKIAKPHNDALKLRIRMLGQLIESNAARWRLKDALRLPRYDLKEQDYPGIDNDLDELQEDLEKLLEAGKAAEAKKILKQLDDLARNAISRRARYAEDELEKSTVRKDLAVVATQIIIHSNDLNLAVNKQTEEERLPPEETARRRLLAADKVRDRLLAVFAGATAVHELDLLLQSRILTPDRMDANSTEYKAAKKAGANVNILFTSEFTRPNLLAPYLTPYPEVAANIALEAFNGISSLESPVLQNSFLNWMRLRFDNELKRDALLKRKAELTEVSETRKLDPRERKELRDADKQAKILTNDINKAEKELRVVLTVLDEMQHVLPEQKAYPALEKLRLHSSWALRNDALPSLVLSRKSGRYAANRLLSEDAAFGSLPLNKKGTKALRKSEQHPSTETAVIGSSYRGGIIYYLLKNWKSETERIRAMGYEFPDISLAPLVKARDAFIRGYALTKPENLSSADPALANAEKAKYTQLINKGNKELVEFIVSIAKIFEDAKAKQDRTGVTNVFEEARVLAQRGDKTAQTARFLYERAWSRYKMVMGDRSAGVAGLVDIYTANPSADFSSLSSKAWAHQVRAVELLVGAITSLQDAEKVAKGLGPVKPGPREERPEVEFDMKPTNWLTGRAVVPNDRIELSVTFDSEKLLSDVLKGKRFTYAVFEDAGNGVNHVLSNDASHGVRSVARIDKENIYIFIQKGKYLDAEKAYEKYSSKSDDELNKEGIRRIVIKKVPVRQDILKTDRFADFIPSVVQWGRDHREDRWMVNGFITRWSGDRVLNDFLKGKIAADGKSGEFTFTLPSSVRVSDRGMMEGERETDKPRHVYAYPLRRIGR